MTFALDSDELDRARTLWLTQATHLDCACLDLACVPTRILGGADLADAVDRHLGDLRRCVAALGATARHQADALARAALLGAAADDEAERALRGLASA